MANFKAGETTRMLLRGRSKALLIETCGSACGMLEGHLCEDCSVPTDGEATQETSEPPSSLDPLQKPLA
jgi:hypothetical protein